VTKDQSGHLPPSNMHSPLCSEATSECYSYSLLTVTVQMMWQGNGCIMYELFCEFLGDNFVSGLSTLKPKKT